MEGDSQRGSLVGRNVDEGETRGRVMENGKLRRKDGLRRHKRQRASAQVAGHKQTGSDSSRHVTCLINLVIMSCGSDRARRGRYVVFPAANTK